MNVLRLIAIGALLAGPLIEHAHSQTVTVSPGLLGAWAFSTSGVPLTATAGMVNGPGTPPLPSGSARFSVGTNGDGAAQLRNTAYAGLKLSDLTALQYSTYVSQYGSGGQAVYIILNIDQDSNGTVDDLLFFEPVYQTAVFFPSNPQAALVLNTWQTWDAKIGGWWSVNGYAGATPGTGVKSLATYIAAFPAARIVNSSTGLGGVRLVAGFGAVAWDNFVGNADKFVIGTPSGTVTYNFELGPQKNADDCKNGGWQGFFQNQGQCVSSFHGNIPE